MSGQNPPAMFAGVKPPPPREQPKATDSTKPSTSATKASGAPVGRFALGSAVPVLALIGAVLWVTVDHAVALIVVGALVALGLLATVARSSARRRVATTTRVRPDGSITTTTKPLRKDRSQRYRKPRGQNRDRTRSMSERRSRWPGRNSLAAPPGGAPGGKTRGSKSQPGGKEAPLKRSLLDRATRRNKPGSAPNGSPPVGPGGSKKPSRRDNQDRSKPPAGPGGKDPRSKRPKGDPRSADTGKRPGRIKRAAKSVGDTLARSHQANKPPRSPKTPKAPKENKPGSSNGNGQPPGSSDRTKKPSRRKGDNQAAPQGDQTSKGKPSKVPNWVKRIAVPADSPPPRNKDKSRRVKDKARNWWTRAWSDSDGKPAKESNSGDNPKSGAVKASASPSKSESRASLARRWRRRFRPELTDFKTQLDKRWEARGIGQKSAPKHDPVVKPKPQVSSAESAAFAEDWSPAPQQHRADRQSAEAGLMAEGDWTPSKPPAPASRASNKERERMSDSGSPTNVRLTAAAYQATSNGARAKADRAADMANQLKGDAGRAPEGVDASGLARQSSKWNIVAQLRSAYASSMSDRAANIRQ